MDIGNNFYPNGDNYPVVSFPQELIPPDEDADDPDAETLIIEYNPAWTPVLLAAADQLMQYSTWEGDHDAKILAVNRASVLKWLLQHPADVAELSYPTPYWDSETDVDDQLPADEQDWYGYVTDPDSNPDEITFVQSAVIWILTGFVALVLSPALPVGAAAAIAFRTFANRFTLAFNRGDIGEQFRVIIDAADYETVDTSGMAVGDIVEIDINGLPEDEFHDIVIVRTETV